jgi:NADPH:quinone reductase-like Zn-dependent oxidoreductase
MKTIVQDRCGSTDVLELRDIDKPVVGDGDVLLRVHAAGVDSTSSSTRRAIGRCHI